MASVQRGRQRKSAHPAAPDSHVWRWVLEHAVALATIAGLVLYGLVRLGIDAFYSQLGVTAEEVGLTYATILSQAAVGLLVALVAAILAGSLSTAQFLVGYFFAGKAIEEQNEGHEPEAAVVTKLDAGQVPPPWFVIVLLSIPSGILVLLSLGLVSWSVDSETQRIIGIAAPIYALVGTAISYRLAIVAARPAVPNKARWPQAGWRIAIAVFLLLATVAALWASNRAGYRAAQRVASGQPTSRGQSYGLQWIFDVEAKCVTLARASDGTPPPGDLPTRLLYLGQSDNTLVFYSAGVGPIRLPAGDYVLTGIATDSCRS
jgi:hypothetical protein